MFRSALEPTGHKLTCNFEDNDTVFGRNVPEKNEERRVGICQKRGGSSSSKETAVFVSSSMQLKLFFEIESGDFKIEGQSMNSKHKRVVYK